MSDDKEPELNSSAVEYEGVKDLFTGRFEDIPFESPVKPVQLSLDTEIQFDCHPGISCFNECCRNIDIQITPYDIVRLKNRLGMTSSDFVNRCTVPFEMDAHGMPGLKMATKPDTRACVFLSEEGCTVYEDRPAACRYYAVGSMGVRKKDTSDVEDMYFLVKESHCKGHDEPRKLTVREYRRDQGVEKYDEMNREWREIVLKKRSSGPTVGAPSARSMQLFDMCSYDMDSFREFIQTDGFKRIFDVPDDEYQVLLNDDEALLLFAARFLKQALFGENSIAIREGAREERIEQRRDSIERRRREQSEREAPSQTAYGEAED